MERFLTYSQHVKMCAASRSDEGLRLTPGCLANHTRYPWLGGIRPSQPFLSTLLRHHYRIGKEL